MDKYLNLPPIFLSVSYQYSSCSYTIFPVANNNNIRYSTEKQTFSTINRIQALNDLIIMVSTGTVSKLFLLHVHQPMDHVLGTKFLYNIASCPSSPLQSHPLLKRKQKETSDGPTVPTPQTALSNMHHSLKFTSFKWDTHLDHHYRVLNKLLSIPISNIILIILPDVYNNRTD